MIIEEASYNGSNNIELHLNGSLVYPYDRWYGVRFTGSSADGTRIGNMDDHRELPILSMMTGCTMESDGTVKWLNPSDWTKYIDGTDRDYSLNTMVYIPRHYRRFETTTEYDEIRISRYPLAGYVEVKEHYVSAYEAYRDTNGNLLKSVKDVLPTTATSRTNFLLYARNNGSEHWNMYTYECHKAITWLFVVEYATRHCQKAVNLSLTADGYRLGGLGTGVTNVNADAWKEYNGYYPFIPCGYSDSLANGSGSVAFTMPAEYDNNSGLKTGVSRYRGIENPFGHIWKNVIDVIITGEDNSVYLTKDYTKFGNDKTKYDLQPYKESTTAGYTKSLINSADGELFGTVGGSASSYYHDYKYTNPTATDRTLIIGGHADAGGGAGLFCLRSHTSVGDSAANFGSRLTYLI